MSLNNNDLKAISPGAFNGPLINSLIELSLERNLISQVPQTGVVDLKNLKKFILKHNSISQLPARAFSSYASAPTLDKIDLSENALTTIDPVSLEGLTSIKELSLETNAFTDIPAQVFTLN